MRLFEIKLFRLIISGKKANGNKPTSGVRILMQGNLKISGYTNELDNINTINKDNNIFILFLT